MASTLSGLPDGVPFLVGTYLLLFSCIILAFKNGGKGSLWNSVCTVSNVLLFSVTYSSNCLVVPISCCTNHVEGINFRMLTNDSVLT